MQLRPRFRKLQVLRRCVQWGVVVLLLLIPTTARYNNYLMSRQLDRDIEKWEGSIQGGVLHNLDQTYRAMPHGEKERVGQMVRNRDQVLKYGQQLRGGPWSAQIGPVSMTDPLAGAESLAASKQSSRALWIGLAIPVLLALVLGRVFCSWICPMNLLLEMTDKLRGVLRFLELSPRNLSFSRGTKYALLGLGLILTFFLALPVLSYIYPPAILGRESHAFVFDLFDRAEGGKPGWWWGGLTGMSLLILGIALFEVTVSRRWWCRYVCPGGALYALLGRYRSVRIKLHSAACTQCAACIPDCGMGLNPMADQLGSECDNCGLCISQCQPGALSFEVGPPPEVRHGWQWLRRRKARRAAALLVLLVGSLVAPATATAHHILGVPHYAYDEQYPQVPVLTYRVELGSFEVKMTGYPGIPKPGERCTLHLYLRSREDGTPFDGEVTLEALQDRMFASDDVIYGPVAAEREDALYKFYPRFSEEANYLIRIRYHAGGEPYIIDLPMVVGDPGSPWSVLGGLGVGLGLFLIIIRALRIKMRRAAAREALAS